MFRARLGEAEITDNHDGRASFHSIRSTAATWLAKQNVSEPLIAALLGHTLRQTVTQSYIRFPAVPEDAVRVLDEHAMRPLAEILEETSFGKFRFRDHIACWSRIDFMIQEQPEAFGRFAQGIKGQFDARGGSLRGPAVLKRFREAFQESFACEPKEFDVKWKAWAQARRTKKRR